MLMVKIMEGIKRIHAQGMSLYWHPDKDRLQKRASHHDFKITETPYTR